MLGPTLGLMLGLQNRPNIIKILVFSALHPACEECYLYSKNTAEPALATAILRAYQLYTEPY
jgi:hypothetical protein